MLRNLKGQLINVGDAPVQVTPEQDFIVDRWPDRDDEHGLNDGAVPLRIPRLFTGAGGPRMYGGLKQIGWTDAMSGLGGTLRLRPPRIPAPNRMKSTRLNRTNPMASSQITVPAVFVGAGRRDGLV